MVEDSGRVLGVSQVGLNLKLLLFQDLSWNLDTLLQLGYMENIMYGRELFWELDPVSNGSTNFHNFIRTNVTGSQFSFYSKPLHSFGQGDSKIHVITNVKL